MKNTGAEIFIEALRREGVEVIFGYPGVRSYPSMTCFMIRLCVIS